MRYIILLLITGCASTTPYLETKHMSVPTIANDGYDLGCGGIKYYGRINMKAGACQNIRGGTLIEVGFEYDLFKVNN